jgi:hypothetical protein
VEHRVVAYRNCEVRGLVWRLKAEMLAVVGCGSRNVTDGKGRNRLAKARGSASSSRAHALSLPDTAGEWAVICTLSDKSRNSGSCIARGRARSTVPLHGGLAVHACGSRPRACEVRAHRVRAHRDRPWMRAWGSAPAPACLRHCGQPLRRGRKTSLGRVGEGGLTPAYARSRSAPALPRHSCDRPLRASAALSAARLLRRGSGRKPGSSPTRASWNSVRGFPVARRSNPTRSAPLAANPG